MGFKCTRFPPLFGEIALSYSIDVLKKSVFEDELINTLSLIPVESVDEDTVSVIEYFKRRIKELDAKTKI